MFLISTHGKTLQQVTEESWQAFQKYQKVSKEVERKNQTNLKESSQKEELTVQQLVQQANKKAKLEGNLLEEKSSDKDLTQVIFFRHNPKYKPPVKK